MKALYRGQFNLNRFPVIIYRQAHSEKQAWLRMCRAIARKDKVDPRVVMNTFDGSRDNYKIEIEGEPCDSRT